MKWRPGVSLTVDAILALDRTMCAATQSPPDWEAEMQLVDLVRDAIAEDQRLAACLPLLAFFTPSAARLAGPSINRFLAAHAFASWWPIRAGSMR